MFGCKEMDIATLQGLQTQGSVALVDVRTDAEVARGVIEGAKHIPLHMLPMRLWPLRAIQMCITYKAGLWHGLGREKGWRVPHEVAHSGTKKPFALSLQLVYKEMLFWVPA